MPHLIILVLTLILTACGRPPESSASAATRIAERIISVIDQAEGSGARLAPLASILSEYSETDIEVPEALTALHDLSRGLSRDVFSFPSTFPPVINIAHEPLIFGSFHDNRRHLALFVYRDANAERSFRMHLALGPNGWKLQSIPRPVGEVVVLNSVVDALERQIDSLPSGFSSFSTAAARLEHLEREAGHLHPTSEGTNPSGARSCSGFVGDLPFFEPGTFTLLPQPRGSSPSTMESDFSFRFECDYCGMAYRFRGIWQPDAWIFPTEPELIAEGAVPEGG